MFSRDIMDSPKTSMMISSDSHHISICKGIRTDDSGYVTVTPSSAESLLSDSSGNSSQRRSFYRPQHDSLHHSLFTPEEVLHPSRRKSRPYHSKPKYLMRDSYPDDFTVDKHCSLDSNIALTDAKEFRLPILHEINHESAQDSFLKRDVKCLKRQNAMSDDEEWSCEATTHHLVSPCDSHSYITVLQNLDVNDQEKSRVHDKRTNYRTSVITSSASDPSDYSCRPISLFVQPESSGSSSKQESTPCVSCPITPTKYRYSDRKKIRRLSPDESYQDSLTRTPEKIQDSFSPIFKFENHFPERKSAKKLDFSQQKIGTPEKYQILYPQLKPVTPPKKIKTPEKIRKSALKASTSKCRKSLQLKRQNFCGRENIDFLKMLGEKQSHWPAIKSILSELSCDDLSSVCQVSRCWRNVCQGEPAAERRRKKNVVQKERMKENLMIPKPALCPKRLDILPHGVSTVRRDLMEIQNHSNVMPLTTPAKARSPPVSPGKRRFNMFIKVILLCVFFTIIICYNSI